MSFPSASKNSVTLVHKGSRTAGSAMGAPFAAPSPTSHSKLGFTDSTSSNDISFLLHHSLTMVGSSPATATTRNAASFTGTRNTTMRMS